MSHKGGGARGRGVKMRTRPIDITKPLPLVDTSESNEGLTDQPDIEITGQQASTQQASGAIRAPIIHHNNDTDNITVGSKSKTEIPIPPVNRNDKFYDKMKYSVLTIPAYFVKSHIFTSAGVAPVIELYDLQHDDVEWLNKHNTDMQRTGNSDAVVTEGEMASMIDMFEKEAGKLTTRNESLTVDEKEVPEHIFSYQQAQSLVAYKLNISAAKGGDVYTYWIGKRRRLGKALLPYYQEPPPRGNTSPHVAFRPRVEARRQSKRHPKKEDYTTPFVKLQQLRGDMQRVLSIANHVCQREQIKLDSILVNAHLFDAQLAATPLGKLLTDITVADDKRNTAAVKQAAPLLRTSLPQPPLQTAAVAQSRKSAKKSVKKGTGGMTHSVSKDILPRPASGAAVMPKPPKPPRTGMQGVVNNIASVHVAPPELKPEDLSLSDEADSDADDDVTFYSGLEAFLVKRIKLDQKLIQPDPPAAPEVYPPENVNGLLRSRIGRNNRFIIDRVDYTAMRDRVARAAALHRPIHYVPYDYHIDSYDDDIDAFGLVYSTGHLGFTYDDLGKPAILHDDDLLDLPDLKGKLTLSDVPDNYLNMHVDKLPLLPQDVIEPAANGVKAEATNSDIKDTPMITA